MSRLIKYLLLLLIPVAFSACTLEQRLAKTYVSQDSPGDFYILKPAYLFKYNLKEFEIQGLDTLNSYLKDSLLLANSLFLKDVSDSAFIDEFVAGLTETLEAYGAEVLPEHAVDTLMRNGGNTYILNIAQFTLEEYIHPYRAEEYVYDEIIVIDGIDINAVNFNLWLELGVLNSESGNKVLFASDYLFDYLNGVLKQNLVTGKMSFEYTIDTLTTSQIYATAKQFGKRTASYLYDYLMNKYIDENIPESHPYQRTFYHYDPVRRLIYQVSEEDRLLEIENF